jgi:hypothetical protein
VGGSNAKDWQDDRVKGVDNGNGTAKMTVGKQQRRMMTKETKPYAVTYGDQTYINYPEGYRMKSEPTTFQWVLIILGCFLLSALVMPYIC